PASDGPSPAFAQVRGHYPPYPRVIHHGMVDERPGQSRKSTISIIAPRGCLHARGRYELRGEPTPRGPQGFRSRLADGRAFCPWTAGSWGAATVGYCGGGTAK